MLADLDRTPRYAPTTVMTVRNMCPTRANRERSHGGMSPVTRAIAHPIGNHPANCPLIADCVALELQTEFGSRWYGCEDAYINSELRMVVVGTPIRDEVRMKWKVAN